MSKTQPAILRDIEITLTYQGTDDQGYCLFVQEVENGYPPVPIQVMLPWLTWGDMNAPSEIFVTVMTGG